MPITKEQKRELTYKWREQNPERFKEIQQKHLKGYYQRHKDVIKQRALDYYYKKKQQKQEELNKENSMKDEEELKNI